jgi:hypothetical protein
VEVCGVTKSILEYISKKERDAVPAEDFAGPHSSFPIRNQGDVDNAARLIGHAENPDAVKAAIIRIAKKKGLSLPGAWQTSDKKESSNESTPFSPKSRVATFKTKFLTDGAQSRNKRTYPQEAVDRLVRSGQLQLDIPGSDPLTCYISHGEADNDNSLKLAGKITKVWKSGSDAWANIEMPDTTTGREAATLAKHGFLKTSLRATGAELRLNKNGGMPEVSGEGLRLLGIDFTTTPGIETVTVEDVTLESSHSPQAQDINEIFEMPTESLLLEEVVEEEPNPEEASTDAHTLMIANKTTMQAIHDHIAMAQGRSCASGSMEAGRKFSASTQSQLNAAHDKTAEVLGIECGGASSSTSGDDDMDNDDDPNENTSSESEETKTSKIVDNQTLNILETSEEETDTMTPEEMIQALKEAGFSVEPPKTAEEKLQEVLNTKLAEMETNFNAKLEEATNKLATANVTKGQRTSLVEGNNTTATTQESNPKIYRKGSYLTERLKGMNWEELADREYPLPDGIDATRLLQEFGHLYLYKTGYYNQD